MTEQQRCEDCGGYVFFNHHCASGSSDGWRVTHGIGPDACAKAAEAMRMMPITLDFAIQSLVEIEELLGCFVNFADDDEYCDVKELQRRVHEAWGLASEGVRSEQRAREAAKA